MIILIMISPPFMVASNSSTCIKQPLKSTEQISSKEVQQNHVWPMEKNDAQRTGRSMYDSSQNKGGEKWKFFVEYECLEGVAIDKDDIVYVAAPLDGLYAIYPNGTVKWKYDFEGFDFEYQTPTIAPDGTIYIATSNDHVYAFYPNGTLKWVLNIGGNFFTTPAVDSQGTIYVSTQEGFMYAITTKGTIQWERNLSDWASDVALDAEENIYFYGAYNNSLTCLNPDGSIKWVHDNLVNILSGPVIGDDGSIYLVGPVGYLYAFYPNGTEKWEVDYGVWLGSPSIAFDGTIICAGYIYVTALNPKDGSIVWRHKYGEECYGDVSAAAIGRDGTIYFAYDTYSDSLAFVCALNPDGSFKWETHLTADEYQRDYVFILSDPAIGSDGTVYITSTFGPCPPTIFDIGVIHAIGIDNASIPEPPSINGSPMSRLFKRCSYTITCSVPAGEDVYYLIDWDDNPENVIRDNNWIGPYPSGQEIKVNHVWQNWGNHTIKVRVKNSDNVCSNWVTLEVKQPSYLFFERLFERFPNAFPILRYLLGF